LANWLTLATSLRGCQPRAGRLGAILQLRDLHVGLLRDRPPCGHARAALLGRASPGLLARDQMLRGCEHLWRAWCSLATQAPTPTETTVVGLEMKPVGEPYAGNPHVRFDERGVETERWPHGPKQPRLSSTLPLSSSQRVYRVCKIAPAVAARGKIFARDF